VPQSGAGLVIGAIPRLFGDRAHVAYLGLGIGTLSCFARPGQTWSSYEIDPTDVSVAREQFGYLRNCRPETRIIVGDARLMLASATAGDLDVLVADAFSSDSVPLHLITREAFRVYGRALRKDGVLVMHITNRFLDLKPVIAAIADAEGWTVRYRDYRTPGLPPRGELYLASSWVVLTRSPERMAAIEAATAGADGASSWQELPRRDDVPVWSDDFASILPVLRWRK
jgi:spermidine synthase